MLGNNHNKTENQRTHTHARTHAGTHTHTHTQEAPLDGCYLCENCLAILELVGGHQAQHQWKIRKDLFLKILTGV